MLCRTLLIIILCAVASPGWAEDQDFASGTLIDACDAPWAQFDNKNAMFLRGYCVGVINALVATQHKDYCIPANTSVNQALNVATKYIRDSPTSLKEPFPRVAEKAFAKAWHC